MASPAKPQAFLTLGSFLLGFFLPEFSLPEATVPGTWFTHSAELIPLWEQVTCPRGRELDPTWFSLLLCLSCLGASGHISSHSPLPATNPGCPKLSGPLPDAVKKPVSPKSGAVFLPQRQN